MHAKQKLPRFAGQLVCCVRLKSILALPGGLSLFLALYAGLFIMLTSAGISEDTGAGTLALPTLEGALQGLILTNMNFHRPISPLSYAGRPFGWAFTQNTCLLYR